MQRGPMGRGMGTEMTIMRNMHKRKTARRPDDRYYGPRLLSLSLWSCLGLFVCCLYPYDGVPMPCKLLHPRIGLGILMYSWSRGADDEDDRRGRASLAKELSFFEKVKSRCVPRHSLIRQACMPCILRLRHRFLVTTCAPDARLPKLILQRRAAE